MYRRFQGGTEKFFCGGVGGGLRGGYFGGSFHGGGYHEGWECP